MLPILINLKAIKLYGVCNLSIVPVRTEASDRSELCTQLLFGDGYILTEESENKKWVKIRILHDEYEGWIDVLQHNEVDHAFFEAYSMQPHDVCFDDVAMVESSKSNFLISLGSTLPFLKNRLFKIGNTGYTFSGDLYDVLTDPDEEFIKFISLRFMDAPYLWGGKTLFGTDCSGFVQQVFKLCGYKIKRDAYQQAEHGRTINDICEIRAGDLAFFENDKGRIVHVGISLGENKIIHAHGQVRIDVVDEKGIFNLSSKKYSHKLTQIQRIIQFS